MNAASLIQFLPMAIMIASLSWATYSVESIGSAMEPSSGQPTTKPTKRTTLVRRAESLAGELEGAFRDVFQSAGEVVSSVESENTSRAQAQPMSDPNIELVKGLTLEATFIQGRRQIAVVGGRIYRVGQHLNNDSGQPLPLSLTKVFFDKIVLQSGQKHYVLAYPRNLDAPVASASEAPPAADLATLQNLDPQLALAQMLLRSPLGGLGANLLGARAQQLASAIQQSTQVRSARRAPAQTSTSLGARP